MGRTVQADQESIIFIVGKLTREGTISMEAKVKKTPPIRLLKREQS